MNKNLIKIKEGILIGVGFLGMLVVGTYAFNNYYTAIPAEFESGMTLSSDTFNQVLTNIEELKSKSTILEEKVNSIQKTSDNIIAGYLNINGGTDTKQLLSPEITLTKGTYFILPVDRNLTTTTRKTYDAVVSTGTGKIFSGLSSTGPGANSLDLETPFILYVKTNEAKIKFRIVLGDTGTITNPTGDDRSYFTYYKISD